MATTVLHVCDKCGRELKMSSSTDAEEWERWMRAEATLASTQVSQSDKGIFRFLWCKRCFERILQSTPRAEVMVG